ncbi:MAG TPA: hypothetical protein DIC52_11900, partial [Candidatus Latescibacteria bacterium]|nr:hypothetical protein [Candidatus Latescibacterota bacterium]
MFGGRLPPAIAGITLTSLWGDTFLSCPGNPVDVHSIIASEIVLELSVRHRQFTPFIDDLNRTRASTRH